MTELAFRPLIEEKKVRRTWTQTSGFVWSSTSASCIAPSACSSLPRRRKVAALISQSELSSRASRAVSVATLEPPGSGLALDATGPDGEVMGSDGGGGVREPS